MAVVLESKENTYFSSSPLRRSHSQPKFVSQSSYSRGPPKSKGSPAIESLISPSNSANSSAQTSPRTLHADSSAPSFSSTPASSLSLDNSCGGEVDDDQIVFPSYDEVGYYDQVEDLEPPASPHTGDSYTVSPASNTISTNASRPESPELLEHAEDDTAIRIQPSRHVDYLSHAWKEEDIWSSWKHIVSKRGAYSNSARLENASWRTWTKSKNRLKTVSPETLNWLKDCDVTWLYGPLQTGSEKCLHIPSTSPASSSRISKSNSFLNKKPILKKRSMSEIMLQRSISSSSLLKQAAAAVQAQQYDETRRPGMGRATSDFPLISFPSRRLSQEHPSMLSSVSSSGLHTPGNGERKRIHFNEQVEQCIALDMKGDEDEESETHQVYDQDGSDSDDGGIVMKRTNSHRKLPPLHRSSTPKPNFNADGKTIAMLPSTTLKYREDTPETAETASHHNTNLWNSSRLSPSASQETLRPSKPSTRILLGSDDEDDEHMDWQPPSAFASRKDTLSANQDRLHQSLQVPGFADGGEPAGMRRTPSGMFMPYEEDEDDIVSEGLFGRVVDTVNTARDIAHVIWNVGWRR